MRISASMFLLIVFVVTTEAAEPPKVITFKKGVVFDHEGHKGECLSCHDNQKGGQKIPGFSKEWAHKVCVDCHTSMGSGPTACNDCHRT